MNRNQKNNNLEILNTTLGFAKQFLWSICLISGEWVQTCRISGWLKLDRLATHKSHEDTVIGQHVEN